MTIKELDAASAEIASNLNTVMAKYQLTPAITYYLLKDVESQLANLRIQEYILTEEQNKQSEEINKQTEKVKSKPNVNRIPMKELKERVENKIKEKIKNGEINKDGSGSVYLTEVMKDDSESAN